MKRTRLIPRAAYTAAALFLVNALLIFAIYSILFYYFRLLGSLRFAFPEWVLVVLFAVFAGQLLVLSLVGALDDKRRWAMWLSVLPFIPLLTLGILPYADRNWLRYLFYGWGESADVPYTLGQLWILFYANLVAPVYMALGGVLLLSVICWPLKVFLGWGIVGQSGPEKARRRVSTLELILWLGLWSVLFFIVTLVRDAFGTGWFVAALIAVPVVLLAGLPVALACSGSLRWYVWLALPAYVLALSYGEAELSHLIAGLTPQGGAGMPLVYPLCFNATLASVVSVNLLVMRAFGLRLHAPLRYPGRQSEAASAVEGLSDSATGQQAVRR